MYSVERFTNPELFAERAMPVLSRHEAENNLPIGVIANILAGEYSDPSRYFALVDRAGRPVAVVLRTPPFNALVSYSPGSPSAELVETIASDLLNVYGASLRGITADTKIARALAEYAARTADVAVRRSDALRIYELTEVSERVRASGCLRRMDERDHDLFIEWTIAFSAEVGPDEAINHDAAVAQLANYVAAEPHQRGLMLWEHEGHVVSMVGYSGPTPSGIRIGPVYTPPELRGRGYASAAVAATSRMLLDGGRRFCFLFTELANPTSNYIYREIGYRPVSDVDMWSFTAQ